MTAPMREKPDLVLASLGAGVQSTTLALLSAAGDLPKLDGAIFADTGWEPDAVYRHLDRLEQEILIPAGIPLYRVSRGNLHDDLLNPDKMAMIPAYTLGPEYPVTVVDHERPCHATGCRWRTYLTGRSETADFIDGQLDLYYQEDEAAADAAWAEFDEQHPEPAPCSTCGNTGSIVLVSHTEMRRDKGMLGRKCTGSYKLGPIRAQTRLLLGGRRTDPAACRFCDGSGARIAPWRAKRGEVTGGVCSVCDGDGLLTRVGQPPAGAWAEQWVGFSTDENMRVSGHTDARYVRSRYPLLELGMSRDQCSAYLKSHGWDSVEKSACTGCSYHGNAHWRRVRDTCDCRHHRSRHTGPAGPCASRKCSCSAFYSTEWAKAVQFDRDYRTGPGMKSERFLHISCKPLDQAPINYVRPGENEQLNVSDAAYAVRLEEGDPDGCSPMGCRSGIPVEAA